MASIRKDYCRSNAQSASKSEHYGPITEAIESSSWHPSQRYSTVIAQAMAMAYWAYSSATGGHEQQQCQLAAFDPPALG